MSRMSTGMELEGLDSLNAQLAQLRRDAPELALDIAELAGEALVSEMQLEEVVPYAIGILSEAHGVERQHNGIIIFASTDYAAAQHANHPTKSGWMLRTMLADGMRMITGAAKIVFARQEQAGPQGGGAS